MKINVHIERLILEDLPVGRIDAKQVGLAVERELAHLLAARGLRPEFRGGAAVPRARGGEVQVASETRPVMLGQGIARAIHEGLSAPKRGGTKA